MQFDVVIPAYNAASYLPETLDSILAQTHLPNQIIVIDDGSTDNTPLIAKNYHPLVTCHTISNSGPGYARKVGIDLSTSPWIALCDSDDLWNCDHLERRSELLSTFPQAKFTFSDCYSFGPNSHSDYRRSKEAPTNWYSEYTVDMGDGFYRVINPYLAFLKFNPAFVCGIAFERKAYHQMGGFIEKYSRWNSEDSEFTRRFVLSADQAVIGDHKATWGYRRHDTNFSRDQWKNSWGRAKILKEHLQLGIIPASLKDQQKQEIENALYEAVDYAYWNRDISAMKKIFFSSDLSACRKLSKRVLKSITLTLIKNLKIH